MRSLIDRGKSLEDWKELLCSCGVPARTLDTLSFFAYLESDHQDEAKEIYGVSKRRTVCVCLSGRIVKWECQVISYIGVDFIAQE